MGNIIKGRLGMEKVIWVEGVRGNIIKRSVVKWNVVR